MYAAVVSSLPLHDAIESVIGWPDGVHVGIGSIVLTLNCVFLSAYTFGCHAFRHLIGGDVNSYSTAPLGMFRYKFWQLVTSSTPSTCSGRGRASSAWR